MQALPEPIMKPRILVTGLMKSTATLTHIARVGSLHRPLNAADLQRGGSPRAPHA